MHVISVRNVAQALPAGLNYLLNEGRWESTRNGRALVAPGPVTTVYERPRERVLFSAARDANPFFHLAECLWLLAGRRDAAFLDRFVGDFGARFAEPDGSIHGAYGHRWRDHFDSQLSAGGVYSNNQLENCVSLLAADPGSRQAVIAMWDPPADLGAVVKDKCCNTHVYLRIKEAQGMVVQSLPPLPPAKSVAVLDITVCCRSNDIVLGAYGANAVHFSVLQEYLAARLDVGVGTYYQVSNNYHAYEEQLEKLDERDEGRTLCEDDRYSTNGLTPQPLVHDAESFDEEMVQLLVLYEGLNAVQGSPPRMSTETVHDEIATFNNKFLSETVWPALMAHRHRSNGTWWRRWAKRIASPDWRESCSEWLSRRERARERKAGAA